MFSMVFSIDSLPVYVHLHLMPKLFEDSANKFNFEVYNTTSDLIQLTALLAGATKPRLTKLLLRETYTCRTYTQFIECLYIARIVYFLSIRLESFLLQVILLAFLVSCNITNDGDYNVYCFLYEKIKYLQFRKQFNNIN